MVAVAVLVWVAVAVAVGSGVAVAVSVGVAVAVFVTVAVAVAVSVAVAVAVAVAVPVGVGVTVGWRTNTYPAVWLGITLPVASTPWQPMYWMPAPRKVRVAVNAPVRSTATVVKGSPPTRICT